MRKALFGAGLVLLGAVGLAASYPLAAYSWAYWKLVLGL